MRTELETNLTSGVWTVDPARSAVTFAIRHLGVATVRGRFAAFAGRIDVSDAGLHVDGDVDPASVDTGDEIRDRRLREEFFLVDRHPAIAFAAHVAALAETGETRLTGDLTIRGATRPVLLGVTAERLDDHTVRLRAEGELRRSEFGLEWDALGRAGERLVADRVRIDADVVVVAA